VVTQLIRPQLPLLLPGTQEGPELSGGGRSGVSGVHAHLPPTGPRFASSVGAGPLQRGLLGDGEQLCSLLFPYALGKRGRDRRHWRSYSLCPAPKKSALVLLSPANPTVLITHLQTSRLLSGSLGVFFSPLHYNLDQKV